jgi:sulfur-oxidizing protein SoxY
MVFAHKLNKVNMMAQTRRSFLNSVLALLFDCRPSQASAEIPDALGLAMTQATGGRKPNPSIQLNLTAPDIAEDGALVPVTVESDLPGIDTIWIFVEKNPNPLAARFQLKNNAEAFVSLRIKMNESCEVIAMVKSGDEYFSASKKVRVLQGGCG